MANQKVYQIQINGLTESVKAVDALNDSLKNLEERIKSLEGKTLNVGAKSSGGGAKSSSTSALSEEEKLEKQIAQLEEKRIAHSKEIYQNYLAAKDVLAETEKDQKQIAASERLAAKNYSNTIQGMKQELADIKQVMQTVDLGDSGQMKQMVDRANELNNKLKEIEQSYGQFGRNVDNYAEGVAQGMQKVKIEVGAISREFNNTREATRTLNNELRALEINGKGNTQQAKNLRNAIYNLNSAMKDATVSSRAMDNAMDFMQSFTAMASMGNGLKAFFGFDDNEITKSIQKLVALQGVLNGLESIRKQMETKEGIGKILGRGFEKIDTWTYGLRKLNVQLRGTGTTARIAAAGIKVLNVALKGLLSAGILVGLDLIVEGLQKLTTGIKDWAEGDADLITSTDVASKAIEAQNRVLEQNIELIKKSNEAGHITDSQAKVLVEREYAKALLEANKRLQERAELIATQGINRKDIPNITGLTNLDSVIGDKGTTWIGGFKEGIKTIDDFIKRWDALEDAVSNNKGLDILFNTASDARDELSHLAKLVERDFLNAMNKFSDGTENGTRALVDYIDKMDKLTGGRYSKAIQLVKVDDESLQKELDNAWAMIQNFRDNVFKNPIVVRLELDAKIEQELDRLDPTRAMQRNIDQWTQMLVFGVDDAGNKLTDAQRKNIEKIIDENKKALNKQKQQRINTERNNGKKLAEEQERVERELRQLQIENMEEGLDKIKAQLEEERNERLKEVRKTGIKVKELEAEINKLYNKKIEDAEREHTAQMESIYEEMWEQIQRTYDENVRMNLDSQLTELETQLQKASEKATEIFSKQYASYGGVKFDNRMTDELKKGLGYGTKLLPFSEDEINKAKEFLNLNEKINSLGAWPSSTKELDEANKALDEFLEKYNTTYEDMLKNNAVVALAEENYTNSLKDALTIRLNEAKRYYAEIEGLEKEHSEKQKENELELLKTEKNTAEIEENNRYKQQLARLEENREKGLVTEERYNKLSEEIQTQHEEALNQILIRYNAESERIQQDHMNRYKQTTADGLRGMLNEYRDAFDAISKIQVKQPQYKSGILGDVGIISIKKTKQNYKEALDSYKRLSENILAEKSALQIKLDAGEISFDDFQQAKRELDGLAQDCADAAMSVTTDLKNVEGDFIQSINTYIQVGLQAVQTVMQSLNELQDYENEKEQETLQKENEDLEKALQKQEDIVKKHKDAIDDIEDELANSRGDRRQHLIDQLNAEMEAQRRAYEEQKKIEHDKQVNEKKQEDLEKKKRQQEYKRNLMSILVSNAMAVANGLATQPFVPVGIAMGALAAALGAVQYALAAKQKPYATGGQLDGGQIVGNRHRDGGVKVLGGRAEVEGGEYITNRLTTAKNLDLLEYVNSKKKRIDISDMLEFYNSGRVKTSIQKVRTKFEDGGYIAPLPDTIDIKEQLQNIVVNQDNRPIYVSVVDINNKQADVRRVQTLAGLSE